MPPSSSPIDFRAVTIKDLFSDSYDFEIPTYQRPYSWNQDNAVKLVESAMRTNVKGGVPFIGNIVIERLSDTRFSVIDGQQRLTTLTILFAVLRHLNEENPKMHKRLDEYVRALADPNFVLGPIYQRFQGFSPTAMWASSSCAYPWLSSFWGSFVKENPGYLILSMISLIVVGWAFCIPLAFYVERSRRWLFPVPRDKCLLFHTKPQRGLPVLWGDVEALARAP
jgi:hypothetical protein